MTSVFKTIYQYIFLKHEIEKNEEEQINPFLIKYVIEKKGCLNTIQDYLETLNKYQCLKNNTYTTTSMGDPYITSYPTNSYVTTKFNKPLFNNEEDSIYEYKSYLWYSDDDNESLIFTI